MRLPRIIDPRSDEQLARDRATNQERANSDRYATDSEARLYFWQKADDAKAEIERRAMSAASTTPLTGED